MNGKSLEQGRSCLEEDQVRNHSNEADIHEFTEPNGMHSQVLQEPDDVIETTLKQL